MFATWLLQRMCRLLLPGCSIFCVLYIYGLVHMLYGLRCRCYWVLVGQSCSCQRDCFLLVQSQFSSTSFSTDSANVVCSTFRRLSTAAVFALLYESDHQDSVNRCTRHCAQSADPSAHTLLTSVSMYSSASTSASASRNRSRAIADRSASSVIMIRNKDLEDTEV
jgi:hypothetical protein